MTCCSAFSYWHADSDHTNVFTLIISCRIPWSEQHLQTGNSFWTWIHSGQEEVETTTHPHLFFVQNPGLFFRGELCKSKEWNEKQMAWVLRSDCCRVSYCPRGFRWLTGFANLTDPIPSLDLMYFILVGTPEWANSTSAVASKTKIVELFSLSFVSLFFLNFSFSIIFTPVLLGQSPTWLNSAPSSSSGWYDTKLSACRARNNSAKVC